MGPTAATTYSKYYTTIRLRRSPIAASTRRVLFTFRPSIDPFVGSLGKCKTSQKRVGMTNPRQGSRLCRRVMVRKHAAWTPRGVYFKRNFCFLGKSPVRLIETPKRVVVMSRVHTVRYIYIQFRNLLDEQHTRPS